jgi:hypothetical protein
MQSATIMQTTTMRGAGRFVQMRTPDIIVAPARRPIAFSLTGYGEAMRPPQATFVKSYAANLRATDSDRIMMRK